MVTVGMNYKVLPGKSETFIKACRGIIRAMEGMEGHSVTRLYQAVDEPDSFLIVSDWSSREAFNAFVKSPEFGKVTDWGKEQILAGRPQHEVYER